MLNTDTLRETTLNPSLFVQVIQILLKSKLLKLADETNDNQMASDDTAVLSNDTVIEIFKG